MTNKPKTHAQIISANVVEVTAFDGEIFQVMCPIGTYRSEDYKKYVLSQIEELFDANHSNDKEKMINAIMTASVLNALNIRGIDSGDRQAERTRIGARIRQLREEYGIEARELAQMTKIDAANLSRIEKGRYSVGLDILSRIAAALGKKIDFVEL
ncbi:MAG: helix-turn-helix transcriptional regulator [Bacteroidales bacterium]|nr:helix-turn-helix transcriptional regulator [Bacteroidales bacterium]MBD5359999.1 helix-turn-helix transcriptional regulator [Bacteroides sp.]